MQNLMDLSIEEIAALLAQWGEPKFRARQVESWIDKGVKPLEMTNLPQGLRARLAELPWGGVEIVEKRQSAIDDTAKYLFALEDGNIIEGVLMRYHHGNTLCLSTQVGCRMGCAFCASTLEGRVRNLNHGEMLGQVLAVERDEADNPKNAGRNRAVTNLVLMGSGEPLDNFEQVVRFLWRVSEAGEGKPNISPRNISLSTCGLVPEIRRLPQEAPHITLCISLHAHDDETRSRLMPINNRYPIDQVLQAARFYQQSTGRRIIFEYALIAGVNDRNEDVLGLSQRLKGIPCHVNLIPLNPVKERSLNGSSRAAAAQFARRLGEQGLSATVRRELGTDIEGACGQLRRRVLAKDQEEG